MTLEQDGAREAACLPVGHCDAYGKCTAQPLRACGMPPPRSVCPRIRRQAPAGTGRVRSSGRGSRRHRAWQSHAGCDSRARNEIRPGLAAPGERRWWEPILVRSGRRGQTRRPKGRRSSFRPGRRNQIRFPSDQLCDATQLVRAVRALYPAFRGASARNERRERVEAWPAGRTAAQSPGGRCRATPGRRARGSPASAAASTRSSRSGVARTAPARRSTPSSLR